MSSSASAEHMLVDAAQLRRHAGNLQALRDRFDAVNAASSFITHDSGAYGMLCSWLPAMLETRHRRQDELVGEVAENLSLLAEELGGAAADYETSDTKSATSIRGVLP